MCDDRLPADDSGPSLRRALVTSQAREIWRFNVAVTDFDWYRSLSEQSELDEVNFWQPSPTNVGDLPGTPWLFKLHSPRNYVVGGGFFEKYARMPVGVVWETFGTKNGVASLDEMLERVARYRKIPKWQVGDVGCVVLGGPFFLPENEWIPVPSDWSANIVRGKRYALDDPLGAALWRELVLRLPPNAVLASPLAAGEAAPALGKPLIVVPRLGQGAFRLAVLDAYERRCAVTGERTLPALEAAHIKPFALVQAHEITNGLSFRSDIHRLYDLGYVSVRPDYTFAVSKQIREEFENGRDYYALDGRPVSVPRNLAWQPDPELLDWHYSERYHGG